jgi:MFS family permease
MPFNLFGALIAPLGADNGWSRSEIQFGYLLFTLVGGLTMPIAGALVDRIGARTVALWGLPAFAVGLAAVTAVGDSLAVFYSMWAVA